MSKMITTIKAIKKITQDIIIPENINVINNSLTLGYPNIIIRDIQISRR
jgi:hypothetical protein